MAQSAILDSVAKVDAFRVQASRGHATEQKAQLGQFFTPPSIARLMASMFSPVSGEVRLLDPGAGMGTLTVAFVQEFCNREPKPQRIAVTLYEIDHRLAPYLDKSNQLCRELCAAREIDFSAEVCMEDFIAASEELLCGDLFSDAVQIPRFNYAILNPPYRKIHSGSPERRRLKSIGIETTNLYTGFLSTVIKLLDSSGEFVAITPRSFCNGDYFQPFRKLLLEKTTIKQIHLFDSRSRTFNVDGVLQESVILHAVKLCGVTAASVLVSS